MRTMDTNTEYQLHRLETMRREAEQENLARELHLYNREPGSLARLWNFARQTLTARRTETTVERRGTRELPRVMEA